MGGTSLGISFRMSRLVGSERGGWGVLVFVLVGVFTFGYDQLVCVAKRGCSSGCGEGVWR